MKVFDENMKEIKIGGYFRSKEIYDFVKLSNGWYVIKTEDSKSAKDFRVRTILSLKPQRSRTPKHAHFAIDFYGKLCANKEKANCIFNAIVEVWNHESIEKVISRYEGITRDLPGYALEYILHALNWILDQEDINFTSRPASKQDQLDEICVKLGVTVPKGRKGSQLAISLFCDIADGTHPVEALMKVNLDVVPKFRI